MNKARSILAAKCSEIKHRVLHAASEIGIRTLATYTNGDRFALYLFKVDVSYLVVEGKKPINADLDIVDILRIANEAVLDAIHPGYCFLSENPGFANACAATGIAFIGPNGEVIRTLGNNVYACSVANAASLPVVSTTTDLPDDIETCNKMALEEI